MAHTLRTSMFHNVEVFVENIPKAISSFFASIGDANARKYEFDMLQTLSDVELQSNYNIKRSDIVSYVFRDKLV